MTLTLKTAMDKILLKFHLKKEILSAGLLTYLIAFQLTFETDTLFPNPYVTIKSISNQIVKKIATETTQVHTNLYQLAKVLVRVFI